MVDPNARFKTVRKADDAFDRDVNSLKELVKDEFVCNQIIASIYRELGRNADVCKSLKGIPQVKVYVVRTPPRLPRISVHFFISDNTVLLCRLYCDKKDDLEDN